MTKNQLQKIIIFSFTPILSLPLTIFDISKKSKIALALLTVTVGLFSYLYIPALSNDKVYYFDFYNLFLHASWEETLLLLSERPDFLMHIFFLISAKIGVSFEIIIGLITVFTVGVIFFIFNKISENSAHYFMSFLLIIFAISVKDLFSGLRFYFAISFIILSFYNKIYNKKNILPILLLLIASLIHFSTIIFIFIYFTYLLINNRQNIPEILLFISCLFLFISTNMTLQFIENIGFINDILLRRINAYLEVNNNSNILTANINLQHLFHWFFNIAWIYFAYIYLIITIKRKSSIRTLLYCSFFFINIFFQASMVFFRYSLFIQIIFSLCLIHESIIYRKYNTMYRFILLFLIGFLIQMYQIKDMLIASYFNIDIFLFFTALSKTINPNDFLDPIY